MTREKIANFLTYLCLFLLPWQTVWIYGSIAPSPLTSPLWGGAGGEVAGEYWKLVFYAVEFLIAVTAVIRWKSKVSEPFKKVLRGGWVFYGAVLFLSFFSIQPELSFIFSFHLLFALMLFWLLLDERISVKRSIWFFSLGLVVPCFLGWWQVLTGWSPASTLFGLAEHLAATPGTAVVETAGERLMRAYGTFSHPNVFGGYLVMGILMILGRTQYVGARRGAPQRMIRASIRAIILILFSSMLVITFSRSAWLALVFGIIIFFITLWRATARLDRKKNSRNSSPSSTILSLTGGGLGVGVLIIALVASVAIFHAAIFTRLNATDRLETKSLLERQSEYQMIGEVIKINPFVGIGLGAYTWALAELYPGQPVWVYQPMHNSFLLFFAETGLLGLLFFGFVGWRLVQATLESRTRTQAFSPLVPLVALDHYLWSQWAGLALIAVVLAVFLRNKDKKSSC